jgi:hypothetical protein
MGAAKSRQKQSTSGAHGVDQGKETSAPETVTERSQLLPVGQLLAQTEQGHIYLDDGHDDNVEGKHERTPLLIPQQQLSDGKVYTAHGHGDVLGFLLTPPRDLEETNAVA